MFWKKRDKGVAFVHPDKCDGCGKCVRICGHRVLEITAQRAVACNTFRCTGCRKCVAICPQGAIECFR
jgi:NAD-dependent dihydropyrimidine dehydrogenase PreA subunit